MAPPATNDLAHIYIAAQSGEFHSPSAPRLPCVSRNCDISFASVICSVYVIPSIIAHGRRLLQH